MRAEVAAARRGGAKSTREGPVSAQQRIGASVSAKPRMCTNDSGAEGVAASGPRVPDCTPTAANAGEASQAGRMAMIPSLLWRVR
jgi:hypothetical protein